jgi:large subunit ribosomal protein L10
VLGIRTVLLCYARANTQNTRGVGKMPTEKKKNIIDSLEQTFAKSNSGILTNYRGLKTADVVALRRKLREVGVEYHVVKNTLARKAAEKAGKNEITSIFEGPMAIAFVKEDISKSAKVIIDHIAATKIAMAIKGGFLGNRLLSAKEVSTIATLPSREVLVAKVMGGIQGPLYGLLNQINAPLRGLAVVLQGRIKQLEGAK